MFGISIGVGIGLAVLMWLPVLWSYIYAKRKGVVSPKRFAFFSGCTSYGIQTLIGALMVFPFAVPAAKAAPQYCHENQGAWICDFLDFTDDWANILGLVAAVIVVAVTPSIFNKYVWLGANGR